jgi:hypothetical protein
MAQCPIGSPFLSQVDGGTVQIAMKLLELCLEAGEKRKGVRGSSSETHENSIVVHAAYFFGTLLDDSIAHGNLTVSGHGSLIAAPDQQYRGSSKWRCQLDHNLIDNLLSTNPQMKTRARSIVDCPLPIVNSRESGCTAATLSVS